jgi:hypothetical protein
MRYQCSASALPPGRTNYRRRRRQSILAICAVLLTLALAGCTNADPGSKDTNPQASTTHHQGTPSATNEATVSTGPTYVQVTDLNSFRNQLAVAFSKNNWSSVGQFLSPAFSFQGLDSGGNRMVMPDSETDLSHLYKTQGPWSQASQYEVEIHFCDAGITPIGQQMGFDGNGGSFILVGIERWQGVWLVSWAFQDPNGGGDACAD